MKFFIVDLFVGSIGVYVNIKIVKFLKQLGFYVLVIVKINYYSLVKDVILELVGIISNIFDDDIWGVLVGVLFKENVNCIDVYCILYWN